MPPKLHEAPSNQQRVVAEGKVQRYFPKVRPEFAKTRGDDDAGDVRIGERRSVASAPSNALQAGPGIELDYGRRVKAKAEIVQEEAKRPVERFKAQVVQEDSDEEDADAAQRRRDAMRRQAAAAVEEEELGFSGGEEDEEDSGEWTEESEDEDQADHRVMLKPVFVPKNKRATIAQREELELEEERVAEQEIQRLAERKEESKLLLAKELAARSAPKTYNGAFAGAVVTDDEVDADDAFELWKIRELTRVKRDREEREKLIRDKAEIERRRLMTDSDVLAENERLGLRSKGDRGQMGFMQKYYHKGSYFMDDAQVRPDSIYNRDYNAPTEAEKTLGDVSALPAPMQLRRGKWGKIGQTKWTHLSNEDTTFKSGAAPMWAAKEAVRSVLLGQTGGLKPIRTGAADNSR